MEKVKRIVGTVEFHCLLAAVVFISLCSKSSFLYPINDWGDVNCYFIIGQGMTKGLVPYRDLYDQKGIVVYAVFAIANIISSTSFLGVYIWEIISAFFFLLFSMKIADLFVDIKKYSFPLSFILAGSVYSSASICHGGSVEELLLPLFSYGLYLCIKQILNKKVSTNLEMFIFGILAGLIFFSKFTLCIYYLVLILVMIIDAISTKQFALLMKRALVFICGCILVCIPVIAYFVFNGALFDFYKEYFYNSIFNYTPDVDVSFMFRVSTFFRKRNILDIILIGLSLFYLFKEKKRLILLCHILAFIAIFYIQFCTGYPHKYYGIPLYSLEAVGLCMIAELLQKKKESILRLCYVVVPLVMIIISYIFTSNRYLMLKSKSEIPQFIFAAEMESYGYEDYHMMNYNNLDDGYYFATGRFPNFRAFIQTNLSDASLKEEQDEIINEGKVEFIVTKKVLCDEKDYEKFRKKYDDLDKNFYTFDDFKYELIDEIEAFYEDGYMIHKLYKIKDKQ